MKKIILDAGHSENGQPDPGASGNGLIEATLNGEIRNSVRNHLQNYDCEVVFCPRGGLSERVAFVNGQKADFFLSVHCNAGGGTGFESWAHTEATEGTLAIAASIHIALSTFYAQKGFRGRGLKRGNLGVLRGLNMPGCLIENLFVDNLVDAEFLKNNVDAIGNEIAYALVVALQLEAKSYDPCANCEKVRALRQLLDRVHWMTAIT